MSRRTEKVESLVRQTVAQQLAELLPVGQVTVTGVDAAPDMRNATVWVGILAKDTEQANNLFTQIEGFRADIQRALAKVMTTKFVPRLTFKHDTGGEYAEHISTLLKDI